MVAQSTPTVVPEPDTEAEGQADTEAQAQAQADIGINELRTKAEICHMIVITCCDLLLEEIFWFQLTPFLDQMPWPTHDLMVDELVREIYDNYVQSQEDLPLEEQHMPEEGQVQDSPSLELRLISSGSDYPLRSLSPW